VATDNCGRWRLLLIILQIATVAAVVWLNASVDAQTAATRVVIEKENAMSTTYAGLNGMTHTVSTPYQGDGATTAVVHRDDLKASFCLFPPRDQPEWWNPETDCPQE